VKTLEKLEAHGPAFISRELDRLDQLIESSSINSSKMNEIRKRRNILARIAQIGGISIPTRKTEL
jgi:hypothetical protein